MSLSREAGRLEMDDQPPRLGYRGRYPINIESCETVMLKPIGLFAVLASFLLYPCEQLRAQELG